MGGLIFPKLTVRDLDLNRQTVLVRVDYNVPIDDSGNVQDDFRIDASLPTLRYLMEHQCRIVIISHMGRPNGRPDTRFSLERIAGILSKKLATNVTFVPDCIGDGVKVAVKHLGYGQIALLENLRFHPEEESDDRNFAKKLAKDSAAQFFVQDGFGVVHRAHASTAAIAEYLPSVAGLLLEREWLAIKNATDNPNRPLVSVLGGAKISDKIELIERFVDISDQLIIGGAMANNFLEYLKFPIGASLHEPGLDDTVKRILRKAQAKFGDKLDKKFIIPVDVAVAEHGAVDEKRTELRRKDVAKDMKIFDIGAKSIEVATAVIGGAGTVIWNGTVGLAEQPEFAHGSARIAMTLAQNPQITSVIGGGDTADFVRKWDVLHGGSFSHVSTGGGASLELMAGDELPGIAALLPA